MKLLAIDTSTDFLSLAVSSDRETVVFHERVGQKHAEQALPHVQELLREAQLTLRDLDGVVYGQGPGSFTGLRIACGLAQGLAFAASLPVIPIPTLDSVAEQAGATRVVACTDARMQQAYLASYDLGTGHRLSPILLIDPDQADAELALAGDGWVGAGDGFAAYPVLTNTRWGRQLGAIHPDIRPHAASYLRLAQSGRYASLPPREADLLYVRNKVALTTREQQARQR
ncbi:tRNA (adenosine(37)-N6)-threonylcarbamoyltransferase complex dimerization subunit type 1 TsaB [Pseudogulbenkiania sp. MAI-1]|uniref:tRNA (adenosine(37)-N6)-threonylcarbamoyltransferase complex dimerization subunit type 1 TsaB n=1 Tax=Pseudogulbenkiania sp. MAI-1 TaxID=990370 RepID=UPI00045E86EE|nr:tRNA (adenosine(37)-N6)-threonylcarbamoyltransferase complex dimerization subunit type 1 TsaB [Pseudogulbenkiania sp. MAI-1]